MTIDNYVVKLTPKAVDDLDEIYKCISMELYAEEAKAILNQKYIIMTATGKYNVYYL